MAGVQTLFFPDGCKMEGANFIDDSVQMRSVWGFGGYLTFNSAGKLIEHCPGSSLAVSHFPNINGFNAGKAEAVDLSCYTQTPAYDLILLHGQIIHPLLMKFMSSEQVVELLEEDQGIIKVFGPFFFLLSIK